MCAGCQTKGSDFAVGGTAMSAVAALNDALTALGMKLTYQAPVSAGLWTVTDDTGTQFPFTVSNTPAFAAWPHSMQFRHKSVCNAVNCSSC